MFQLVNPVDNLKSTVDAFWIYKNTTLTQTIVPIYPDGCSDIVYDLNNKNISVIGCMTKAQYVRVLPKQTLIGIRFKPGRASHYLQYPMNQVTDKQVPIAVVNKNLLKKITFDHHDIPPIISSLQTTLLMATDTYDIKYKKTLTAIDIILKVNGGISIACLTEQSDVCPKTLERHFEHIVGISPKLFAKTVRFQYALALLRSQKTSNLTTIASLSGYSDHAHFTREVVGFTGITPSQLLMS